MDMPYQFIRSLIVLSIFITASYNIHSQPSGGPYGPIKQKYELPVVKGKTYYVAPNGKDESEGNNIDYPTTIESAIKRVVSGDVIIMRGGIYRTGNLTFNQGITIQPYDDEQPIIKGTLIATDWKKVSDSLWYTNWEYFFPAGPEDWWHKEKEEKHTPLHRFNNDAVFVNGKFLESAGNVECVDTDSFYVDYNDKKIYIGVDPKDKLIEITAFRKAIYRTTDECYGRKSDGRGPVIRGLEITQFPDTMVHISGYYPDGFSVETDHGNDVIGTRLENCTFSDCFRIGVFLIGDSIVMKNCKIVNSNTEGLYIVASDDVLLEKNVFEHNNIEKWTGFYPGAVKIFNQSYRVICRDNLILNHPNSNGVWYDVGNVDGVFVNNWVEGVGNVNRTFSFRYLWPSYNGFFFEISKGAICAGNVFVNCDFGTMVLNSDSVEVYNNTYVNSMANFGRTTRGDATDHFGWHPSTGPRVDGRYGHALVNNLFVADINFPRAFLSVWQPEGLCQRFNNSQLKELDYNIYCRYIANDTVPMVFWSPFNNERCSTGINSVSEINNLYPEFSKGSKFYISYKEQVFIDKERRDYQLTKQFSDTHKGIVLPDKIQKSFGVQSKGINYVGAYPVE